MISNYSAFKRDYKSKGKKETYFQGEENGVKFKIVCPSCKAEGESLEHKNWYMRN